MLIENSLIEQGVATHEVEVTDKIMKKLSFMGNKNPITSVYTTKAQTLANSQDATAMQARIDSATVPRTHYQNHSSVLQNVKIVEQDIHQD